MTTKSPQASASGIRSRGGFTLIELLIVTAVIGILAGIAIPKFQSAIRKANAAAILSDYNVIRVAAAQFAADGGSYPGSASWRSVPSELVPYLPDGFDFDFEDRMAEYRWRNWSSGRRNMPTIGLQVRTRGDASLVPTIVNLLGGAGISSGQTIILTIE
jgi:prepilin-type N-terminal cleavage/methylation domain-containing protein